MSETTNNMQQLQDQLLQMTKQLAELQKQLSKKESDAVTVPEPFKSKWLHLSLPTPADQLLHELTTRAIHTPYLVVTEPSEEELEDLLLDVEDVLDNMSSNWADFLTIYDCCASTDSIAFQIQGGQRFSSRAEFVEWCLEEAMGNMRTPQIRYLWLLGQILVPEIWSALKMSDPNFARDINEWLIAMDLPPYNFHHYPVSKGEFIEFLVDRIKHEGKVRVFNDAGQELWYTYSPRTEVYKEQRLDADHHTVDREDIKHLSHLLNEHPYYKIDADAWLNAIDKEGITTQAGAYDLLHRYSNLIGKHLEEEAYEKLIEATECNVTLMPIYSVEGDELAVNRTVSIMLVLSGVPPMDERELYESNKAESVELLLETVVKARLDVIRKDRVNHSPMGLRYLPETEKLAVAFVKELEEFGACNSHDTRAFLMMSALDDILRDVNLKSQLAPSVIVAVMLNSVPEGVFPSADFERRMKLIQVIADTLDPETTKYPRHMQTADWTITVSTEMQDKFLKHRKRIMQDVSKLREQEVAQA